MHFLPEYLYIALVVCEQGEYAVYSGGLSRAVWSEQSENLAGFNGQIEMVECHKLLVAFYKVGYFYRIFGCIH